MTEHYYSKEQTSAFRPIKRRFQAAGARFDLYTAGGVFSPKKLDRGTEILITNAKISKGWNVLDLGCGYGVVGIALKKINPSIKITLSDTNSRAIKLARMNLKLNNMEGKAVQGDAFEKIPEKNFDTIILNPPQTAGKKTCYKLIEESAPHLKEEGLLQIVARHQKGGKELEKKMKETFGNVEETAKKSGYRVYVSKKPKVDHK